MSLSLILTSIYSVSVLLTGLDSYKYIRGVLRDRRSVSIGATCVHVIAAFLPGVNTLIALSVLRDIVGNLFVKNNAIANFFNKPLIKPKALS